MKKMPKYWVYRGGSWFSATSSLRASNRNRGDPSDRSDILSFRLVRRRTE